jgi:hypothetical protein
MRIQISQKAGVDGRLFGSVTNFDIVEALKAQGITIEKSTIRMPDGPLKHVGEFPLVVALYLDVTATLPSSCRPRLKPTELSSPAVLHSEGAGDGPFVIRSAGIGRP